MTKDKEGSCLIFRVATMLQNPQNERRNTEIRNHKWRFQYSFLSNQYNRKYVDRMELNDTVNRFDLTDISGTFQQYKICIFLSAHGIITKKALTN